MNTRFLQGKTALVTGSSAGLGYAMAQALAAAGCRIVLHGLEAPEAIEPARAMLAKQHDTEVVYAQADVSDVAAVERLMADINERYSGPDILVNNAVVRHFSPIESFPVDRWNQALAVNVSAVFHTVRLVLPEMRRKHWGRIVNMSSVYGMRGTTDRIDYVTTKSAILGLTRGIAMETVRDGITCNALCPATVHTPGIEHRLQGLMQETGLDRAAATTRFLEGKQPTGQFIDAAHVADMLVFLCGPAGAGITGAVLPIEGGWLAG
jgi:3-hydroxybutyrate dehydrogenase